VRALTPSTPTAQCVLIISTVAAVAAVAAAYARDGRAANQNRPPTVALFPDPVCLAVVDRSTDPVFHLEYDVAMDDLVKSPDEVSDGRTLQFFAFRRQFTQALPNWITQDDVDRARAAPATGDFDVEPGEILATSSAWPTDQWARIVADDARLPISKAQAGMGVDFDTTGLDAGAWVIAGYTFDPELNAWSLRAGGIHVLDGPDPASAPPAIFLPQDDAVAQPGDEYSLDACVSAASGSVVTASWARFEGNVEPEWHEFATDDAVTGSTYTVQWTVPETCGSTDVKLRVEIRDPAGNTYVAYTPGSVRVLGDPDAAACTEAPPDDPGCSCRAGNTSPAAAWVLALPAIRRRRRAR
jgi:MYXO-CTERM domain-containing protein